MADRGSKHAGTDAADDASMLSLTVRLPAAKRRAFAAMCSAEGVTQQQVVAAWVDDVLEEYAAAQAGRKRKRRSA